MKTGARDAALVTSLNFVFTADKKEFLRRARKKTGNCEENRSSCVECGVILAIFLF